MSITNKTRHIKWHETRKCKFRLDTRVFNNKQRWNNDKCRYECKELIYKRMWDQGFIWIPSNCKYECEKLCDPGDYLDYKNCRCRKRLIDKPVEECNENIDGNEIIYNDALNDYGKYAIFVQSLAIFFIISISITTVFTYFHWYLKIKYAETTIHWMQFYWKYEWEMLKE